MDGSEASEVTSKDPIDTGAAEDDFAVEAVMEGFPGEHLGQFEFVNYDLEFGRHLVLGWGLLDGD